MHGCRVAAGSYRQGHPSSERQNLGKDSSKCWEGTDDRSKVKSHQLLKFTGCGAWGVKVMLEDEVPA